MHMTTLLTTLLVLQCSDLCLTVRVPVPWNNGVNSAVQQETKFANEQDFTVVTIKPQNVQTQQNPVPVEYFQYPAKKPQFAVDVAMFHGVQSPQNYYKAYPIRPYTENEKPELGKRHILDKNKNIYQPFQKYVEKNVGHVSPPSVSYEIFHPYQAEKPALQIIYKDPVLSKIRNDVHDSKNKLQNYEKEIGKPNISKAEYLESPEETDRKLFTQRNVPTEYEKHRPQRRPIYYKVPPKPLNRDHILNQKFKHPWNQNYVKIRPVHYQPIKNHLQRLRQHHALTYDDDRNEYPQIKPTENVEEIPEGYDIYEKGKQKYINLRNNVDESINNVIKENRPVVYQNLELQSNENNKKRVNPDPESEDDEEDEFVPIKSYAQVRKTEAFKHLPREAALEDAETYEEIRNAPRLREAIKSTKAQTVYTEEGYEDAAYDHAGEQKHASDHEGHGGYLKQKEVSGGKYKIPSLNGNHEDGRGSAYRDETVHSKNWENNNKDNEDENETEDFSEDETAENVEAEIYKSTPEDEDLSLRNKRANEQKSDIETEKKNSTESDSQHDLNKREVNLKIPEIDINSTFLSEDEILKISKQKISSIKDDLKEKYPYYFRDLENIHKDSPLRYAENLKLIPKKSKGGTEFYDSRSKLECPEVDDDIDPTPEKLKTDGNPDNKGNEEDNVKLKDKGDENFETVNKQPRLKGLGDKIDCFKAKYFGKNPLDSPFFKEDIIANPEPVTAPNLETYKLSETINNVENLSEKLREENKNDIFALLEKLNNNKIQLQESVLKTSEQLKPTLLDAKNITFDNAQLLQQSNVYADVLDNIKSNLQNPLLANTNEKISGDLLQSKMNNSENSSNVSYNYFANKEDVTKSPSLLRKKRATPFVYEPYKIIKDGQIQDSKKTTTTGNVSPLIKQLQSSRVVDRVSKSTQDKEQPVKRNAGSRTYKDIGRKDREKSLEIQSENPSETAFVDVNSDKRRGEPRYELKPANHKSQYTPIENKRHMSRQDYEARIKTENTESTPQTKQVESNSREKTRHERPTQRPFFDVSKFLPTPAEPQTQETAASKTINKVVTTPVQQNDETKENHEIEEDYEEYDEEEEEEEVAATTTTTSTTTTTASPRPGFRRKSRVTTTTSKPYQDEIEPEVPKLRLRTRFRNPPSNEKIQLIQQRTEKPLSKKYDVGHETALPKYREKKRKSSKSTLVTDTKHYGDDDDESTKKEVDALIGVKQDMEDYMPEYEKETINRNQSPEFSDENNDESYEDSESDEDDEDEEDEDEEETTVPVTTPEPTKRTLLRTTEAPIPTTEARSAKIEVKPIVHKKRIEIHKELPVNKSLPHVTQFKQDIKEVEIVKEIPTKVNQNRPQNNLEALEFYKDENLVKDINNLGDVEIFKAIDLEKGPKHGGNYKGASKEDLREMKSQRLMHGGNLKLIKEDTEASQSENTKLIELDDDIHVPVNRMHGGNLKARKNVQRSRNSRGKNEKFIELTDTVEQTTSRSMHGGNLRSIHDRGRKRGNERRSEKLIELDDDNHDGDYSTRNMHGGNFKPYPNPRSGGRQMHGGNYRSAKIVEAPKSENEETTKSLDAVSKETSKDARRSAAVLLNSFAQAVPILTTTPAYILDPSKRMYYYVDA